MSGSFGRAFERLFARDLNSNKVIRQFEYSETVRLEMTNWNINDGTRYSYYHGHRFPDISKCPDFGSHLIEERYWRILSMKVFIQRSNNSNADTLSVLHTIPKPIVWYVEGTRQDSGIWFMLDDNLIQLSLSHTGETCVLDVLCGMDERIGMRSETPENPTELWTDRSSRVSDNYLGYDFCIKDYSWPSMSREQPLYTIRTELQVEFSKIGDTVAEL